VSTTTLPSYSSAPDTSRHPVCSSIPLLPRNAGLVLLHGYRATISHLYGDVCKYYPSCSAYAVGAVQQHGLSRARPSRPPASHAVTRGRVVESMMCPCTRTSDTS
jgi:hypothetical protein